MNSFAKLRPMGSSLLIASLFLATLAIYSQSVAGEEGFGKIIESSVDDPAIKAKIIKLFHELPQGGNTKVKIQKVMQALNIQPKKQKGKDRFLGSLVSGITDFLGGIFHHTRLNANVHISVDSDEDDDDGKPTPGKLIKQKEQPADGKNSSPRPHATHAPTSNNDKQIAKQDDEKCRAACECRKFECQAPRCPVVPEAPKCAPAPLCSPYCTLVAFEHKCDSKDANKKLSSTKRPTTIQPRTAAPTTTTSAPKAATTTSPSRITPKSTAKPSPLDDDTRAKGKDSRSHGSFIGLIMFDDSMRSLDANSSVKKDIDDIFESLDYKQVKDKGLINDIRDILAYFKDKSFEDLDECNKCKAEKKKKASSRMLRSKQSVLSKGVKAIMGHLMESGKKNECRCPEKQCPTPDLKKCEAACPNNKFCQFYECVCTSMRFDNHGFFLNGTLPPEDNHYGMYLGSELSVGASMGSFHHGD